MALLDPDQIYDPSKAHMRVLKAKQIFKVSKDCDSNSSCRHRQNSDHPMPESNLKGWVFT